MSRHNLLPNEATLEEDLIDFDEEDPFENDERVRSIVMRGVDLKEYSTQIEAQLKQVEQESINDYTRESSNLVFLHQQIESCDSILETMQNLLTGFQSDLGNISEEIKYLQDQSTSLSIKIRNRQMVGNKLSTFIDRIILPPPLIRHICENEVNESFLEYLLALTKKMEFSSEQRSKQVLSVLDVEPDLERLRVKASSKIREFLLQKIYGFARPNIDIHHIQQGLLKFKYFYSFLSQYSIDVAVEVRSSYQEIQSKLSFGSFRNFLLGLLKLLLEIGSKIDLLAAPESSLKGFFTDRYSRQRVNVFSLGEPSRASIFSDATPSSVCF
eukprot:TRINITY_DN3136_c0_g1_i1.p1 TRINITY_DN3136_c0_g1~~TRINITY_DN3136_c0_g1_i1.p1  ORF type:complete len:327 (+),score=51.38 TRINITY_DN3136_c0_g1_i1:29-1009(+)